MYELEIDKAVAKIKKEKAKVVCIQLPDGLKPRAKDIQKEIVNNAKDREVAVNYETLHRRRTIYHDPALGQGRKI